MNLCSIHEVIMMTETDRQTDDMHICIQTDSILYISDTILLNTSASNCILHSYISLETVLNCKIIFSILLI